MGQIAGAPFLPDTAPHGSMHDYSGVLTKPDLTQLDNTIGQLSALKVKVVVLPKDFSTPDINGLTVSLAKHWAVGGNRAVMVVDLKDHKVRVVAGHELKAKGLTQQEIDSDVASYFIPHIKKGELTDAIQSTLTAMNAKVASSANSLVPSTSASSATPYREGRPSQSDGAVSWMLVVTVCGVAIAAVVFALFNARKGENKKLATEFEQRVSALYEQADQIGQGSEFLETKNNPELAQRIATFFNRMTALEQALNDVKKMEKENKVWRVRDGYLNLIRLLSLLTSEATALKAEVDAATGGVETYKTSSPAQERIQMQHEISAADEGTRIPVPQRIEREMAYTRPSWSYEPAYYQPVDNGFGLMNVALLLNQMQMSNQIDQMSNELHHGGQWSSSDSNSNDAGVSGGSWSDTSSGGSGVDIGGGDWGGGAGGVDIGGDSGFDGGGGDWS